MIDAHAHPITLEDFEVMIALPENYDRLFEFIGGEMVEVVSNGVSSKFGILIGGFLAVWVHQHKLGEVTGADGGYMIAGERYIPDAAFISARKQPQPSHESYNPNPPDLVIEVLSPSNTAREMRIKIVNYLRVGAVVWVVDPGLQQIEVYVPGQAPRVLGINDTLDGGEVLPGFTLALREIFGA
jgi:Uma2 family endonuclease